MKVELDKSFPMPGPAEATWAFLQDIESVAACMPGAKITERIDDGRFKGTVTVKIGPATMSFRGEVEVRDIDPAAKSLTLLAKGTDTTGTSGATMDLKARVEAVAEGSSNLVGHSEVSMSGKAAAFGGRMMGSVADQLMQQFAANFAAQVAARSPQPDANATDASPDGMPAGNSRPKPPPVANELNGLALAWAVFKDWLRSLFGRKPA